VIKLKGQFRWGTADPAGNNDKKVKLVHAALDTQIMKDTDPYVPMRTGALKESPKFGHQVGEIVYNTKYARRLYYGETFNFRKTFHPLATHHWLEKAKEVWFKQWVKIVIKLLQGK
jgi:hypothetical protein